MSCTGCGTHSHPHKIQSWIKKSQKTATATNAQPQMSYKNPGIGTNMQLDAVGKEDTSGRKGRESRKCHFTFTEQLIKLVGNTGVIQLQNMQWKAQDSKTKESIREIKSE